MGFDNMRTYLQAKAMAKSLRESLAGKNVSLSHSECLEIVAQQFGFGNWNVLAAKIESGNGVARTASGSGGRLTEPGDSRVARRFARSGA